MDELFLGNRGPGFGDEGSQSQVPEETEVQTEEELRAALDEFVLWITEQDRIYGL